MTTNDVSVVWRFLQALGHAPCKKWHILCVVENRYGNLDLMRTNAWKGFQKLVSLEFDKRAPFGQEPEHGALDGVRVKHGSHRRFEAIHDHVKRGLRRRAAFVNRLSIVVDDHHVV